MRLHVPMEVDLVHCHGLSEGCIVLVLSLRLDHADA